MTTTVHTLGHAWTLDEPLLSTLHITPISTHTYFIPRTPFNPLSLLLSPYILMMGLPLLIMVMMPYLMKNMDPEAMKEMQKAQKDMPSWMNVLQGGGNGQQPAGRGGGVSETLASMMAKK